MQITLERYFGSFGPAPGWDDLVQWPPDVFALTNLVLDHTEAYRFAVAPPSARRWPPEPGWERRVTSGAEAWRSSLEGAAAGLPVGVAAPWAALTRGRATPLEEIRSGRPWELCVALLTLHAMADEACRGLAHAARRCPGELERRAWALLGASGSLSRISPARVRITPKSHFAARGVTIRSFSRYLALCYEAVDVRWQRTMAAVRGTPSELGRREVNMVVFPWPHVVRADDFRPVRGPLDNMDTGVFGFFEFAPSRALPLPRLERTLGAAVRRLGRVDVVVLPEAAVDVSEVEPLERVLEAHGVPALIAGVRERAGASGLGKNRLHLGIRLDEGWLRLEQAKHHRWCVDGPQLRQYHLSRALHPDRQWWEAIDLPERRLQVLDMGGGATVAPLICEDLARLDEVADVLRRMGPTLVIALLLDGPQLPTRWPGRYAAVLADDPGSAVLTVTSLGMALRSRPPGTSRSRAIALWHDAHGSRPVVLRPGSAALAITTSLGTKTVWTADGRCHAGDTPDLSLAAVHQIGTAAR